MHVSAIALAALSRAFEATDKAAEGIARATHPASELEDHADISTEAIRLLLAKNAYSAAIELAKTADEINQRTINLLA